MSSKGPCETTFENNLKNKLKVSRGIHFGQEVINGNYWHNIYKNFNEGETTLIDCFNDHPEIKEKHLKIWKVLSKIHKLIGTPNATEEQLEDLAVTCEELTNIYPLLFPTQDMTRKQHCISMVMPDMIRREKNIYKYLKLEQVIQII